MKIIILASILSTFSLAALAQSEIDTQTVNIGAVSPKYDVSHGTRVMPADEFGQFTGTYDLSNGKTLSLFSRGQKKYAVVEGGDRHEIVATRENSFVSVDQQLKMTIARDDNGDAKGELLIAGPQALARISPAPQKHARASSGPQQLARASAHKRHTELVKHTALLASR